MPDGYTNCEQSVKEYHTIFLDETEKPWEIQESNAATAQ